MLPALAFVPPELVGWSFQQFTIAFPENAYPLCKYFEENYIGQGNVELKQSKFTLGEDPKTPTKSIDNEKAILTLVRSFYNRPILVFVRGIAFRTIF